MEKERKPAFVFRKVIPFVLGAMLIISVLVVSGYFKPVLAFNGQPLSIQAALMQPGDCVDDADGANDEPGQKDLTRGCIETASREPVHVTWNWDITGLSGNNSADGCALFDTDLNGLADYGLCNSFRGTPPEQVVTYPVLYTCNDTRADRCAGGVETPIVSPLTGCTIENDHDYYPYDDPFPAGDTYPLDTVSECFIGLTDVGSPQFPVNLLDVCSYPSLQPNSDPSDCVIRSETKGNLEVHKDVVPDNPATNWVINVTGPTSFTYTLTGDDTTFNKLVTPGSYTITESAGANTSPGYSSSWRCVNSAVTPAVVTSDSGTTINLDVTAGSVWDCFFTNEVKVDITVTKTDAVTSWPWVKRIGTPYMYTIQINHTDATTGVTAYDVSLVDTLDPWLDYLSDETAHPYTVKINGLAVDPQPVCTWVDDATLDGRGGTFSCADIGDLGSADVATVTFWVTPVSGAPVWNFIENGTCTQTPTSMQGTTPVDICNVVSVATSSPEVLYTNNHDSEPADIGLPTAVTLGWFDVIKAGKKGITLGWETVSELENLGFNIYRSRTVDGTKKLLNPDLIPTVNPGSTFGALYTFRDKTARANRVYYYWLEDVDQSGYTTLHGPVKGKLKR